MVQRAVLRFAPLLLLIGTLACERTPEAKPLEETIPATGPVEATFNPYSVNGKLVPRVIESSPLGCLTIAPGASLTLYSSGRFLLQVVTEQVICHGESDSGGGITHVGTYTLVDDILTLNSTFSGLSDVEYIPAQGASGTTPIPGVRVTVGGKTYGMIQSSFEIPGIVTSPQTTWKR